MKVYVLLHSYDYEGSTVVGVYSKREDAEAQAAIKNKAIFAYAGQSYDVEEWEVL